MEDRERVAAVLRGDSGGMEDCYTAYAHRLYAFCHTMLRDSQGAEDAVHDTFVILALRVGQLRDPDRLRPWLYAIARSQCLRQLRHRGRAAPTEDLPDLPDESVNVEQGAEDSALRELVWQAADGLNPGERAALEMSLRHGLEGADLAAALGVPRGTMNKLLQRGREQLERGLAVLLLTRGASDCPELAELTAGWDHKLTVLMRKRIGRHIDDCDICGAARRRAVSAAALFGDEPLAMAPVSLHFRLFGQSHGRAVAADRMIVRQAGQFDRAGFPIDGVLRRRAWIVAIAAASILLLGFGISALPSTPVDSHLAQVPAIGSATLSGSPVLTQSSARTSPIVSTPANTHTSSSTDSTPGSTAHLSSPLVPPQSPQSRSSSKRATRTVTSPAPAPVRGTLHVSTTKLAIGANQTSTSLVVTATGAAVPWKSDVVTAGVLVLNPSSGTVTPSAPMTIKVTFIAAPKTSGSAQVEFVTASATTTVTVEWTQ